MDAILPNTGGNTSGGTNTWDIKPKKPTRRPTPQNSRHRFFDGGSGFQRRRGKCQSLRKSRRAATAAKAARSEKGTGTQGGRACNKEGFVRVPTHAPGCTSKGKSLSNGGSHHDTLLRGKMAKKLRGRRHPQRRKDKRRRRKKDYSPSLGKGRGSIGKN